MQQGVFGFGLLPALLFVGTAAGAQCGGAFPDWLEGVEADATRLSGATKVRPGTPDPGLSPEQMKHLQHNLYERGHDVGEIDGILGARTRAAVRREQLRLDLPADAWPTPQLLSRL